MQTAPGQLIAFEGIDGAGKTTQLARLAARLRAQGLEVLTTREPTDGPHGRQIRAAAGRLPLADELDLFTADRAAHVQGLIAPALARGAWVLIDRYYPSSAAYQGTRPGSPGVDGVLALNEAFAPRPALTLWLALPVEVGLARVGARGAATPFETEATLRLVAGAFASMRLPGLVRIDALQPEDAVEQAIWARVHPLLPAAAGLARPPA